MIGDLTIDLPVGWNWSPLKFVTTFLNRGTPPDYADDGPVRAISQAANQAAGLDWSRTRFHDWAGDPKKLRGYVMPDDVLINSTGTGTLGRVGYFVEGPDDRPCIADGHVTVARADRLRIAPRFLYYWLSSAPFQELVSSALVIGATNQIELSRERLSSAPVALPPLSQQSRIASVLDREVARIDEIINLRVRQRELLSSAQWSRFRAALDAFGTDCLPLRRVLDSIVDGPFGSAFSSSDYSDDGAVVVRLGNIGFAEYRSESEARIPLSLADRFRQHEVVEGDLLIAGLGDSRNHAGRACVAPQLGPAIVKGKCFRARVRHGRASADFLALLLSSPLSVDAFESRGSTRSMINLEIVKSAVLPLPSYSDQIRIAKEVRDYWADARSVSSLCERQITVLAERRQALITSAVTGQFDAFAAIGAAV